jgi:hypothetical protein
MGKGSVVKLSRHVAFMLHGAAGTDWQALKMLEKITQHARHAKSGKEQLSL